MTLSDLRETIEGHAPGSMIPRDWLLEQLGKATGEPAGVESWVDTVRAAEITGMDVEKLRLRATTWRGVPDPPIRVTKNDPDNVRSFWLFAEEDCWSYAREHGTIGPQPHIERDPAIDPNDPDAIADAYLDRVRL